MVKVIPNYNGNFSSNHSESSKRSFIDASVKSTASEFSGSVISDGSLSEFPTLSLQAPSVAKWEHKLVAWSKLLVFFVLLAATAGAAAATHHFVVQEETKDFEDQFRAYASEIVAVARQRTDQLFNTLDKFSVTIASEAVAQQLATNQTWPFVTVDHWSIKVTKFKKVIAAESPAVVFSPIVQEDQKQEWSAYVTKNAPSWYQQSSDNEGRNYSVGDLMTKTLPFIHFYDPNNGWMPTPVPRPGPTLPVWQSFPLKTDPINPLLGTNYDLLTGPRIADLFEVTKAIRGPTIGITQVRTNAETTVAESQIMQPIFRGVNSDADDREMVGVAWLRMEWKDYFQNLLVEGADGITVVLTSNCPKVDALSRTVLEEVGVLSYEVNGPESKFLGEIDAHDPAYDHLEVTRELVDLEVDLSSIPVGQCVPKLTMHLYPSKTLEDTFHTNKTFVYTLVVVLIFVFTSLVFFLYDYFVARRQRKIMDRIIKQDKIVSNVFPTAIRDRLYNAKDERDGLPIDDGYDSDGLFDPDFASSPTRIGGSSPLADLFPNTTVVFADIVGFTAWASAREPQQVFTLLESIYGCFDKIAYRHNVFKVETVGDCYVAVSGLPEPCDNHAIAVARFARDCLKKMNEITLKLEVILGPDTADLQLRVGIHSGQVTAGVLRGERSRFQLFGDTMNTAARMESTSKDNRIQLSQATADLLIAGGYDKMIVPREGRILVKGKGEMQTYWLLTPKSRKRGKRSVPSRLTSLGETAEITSDSSDEVSSGDVINLDDDDGIEGMSKIQRLVEWNVEVLASLLQQIVASRQGSCHFTASLNDIEKCLCKSGTVLEEFVPIISLKRFEAKELAFRRSATSIDIGEAARSELRKYLTNIAEMYTENNSFHNFEHASHVTSSVKKLLKRIVNVEGNGLSAPSDELRLVDLAGHSYGITSDPLTQFAVVFSAVIHDVDHPGVPNAQLVKENTRNAQIYGKSIAEQNSVDLAWEMLMSDEYKALRSCIYQTEEDLKRFRQLVVNTVLATDIVDKELQALRKNRWQVAFTSSEEEDADDDESEDRKATIVIEHLIQASDVSHTMQHWHLYKKWNERFFMECYGAYKAGRADVDPSINWYQGEIGFFDFYVIPLAKKLDNCGVFGVSSDEYLNYATANRDEWVREGESLVQAFLEKYDANYNDKSKIGTQ